MALFFVIFKHFKKNFWLITFDFNSIKIHEKSLKIGKNVEKYLKIASNNFLIFSDFLTFLQEFLPN